MARIKADEAIVSVEVNQNTEVTESNGLSENYLKFMNSPAGWFFTPTEIETKFVGDKAEALGTIKFRQKSLEKSVNRAEVEDTGSYNHALMFIRKDGTYGIMPTNINKKDGEVILSFRTRKQFAEKSKSGKDGLYDYIIKTANEIMARTLEVESLPQGEALKELIKSKLVKTSKGKLVIPIKRVDHPGCFKECADYIRRIEERKERIKDAEEGGEFTVDV